jgi:acyl-CoA synthetase (AMP-forming)/AMP-acid ligase II
MKGSVVANETEHLLLSYIGSSSSASVLTDGQLTCPYQEIPIVFEGLQRIFEAQGIGIKDCLALSCENSVPSALFLLFLLSKGYSFLLLTKTLNTPQVLSKQQSIPQFCQYSLKIDSLLGNESQINLSHLDRSVHFVENKRWLKDLNLANHTSPKLYLRTSGTTGNPKIAVHSHAKLIRNALNCVHRLRLKSDDRIVIPVPISHMYGLGAAFLPSVAVGASIDLQPNSNLLRYLKREKEFNPNIAFMTPTFCETLLKGRKSSRNYKLTIAAGDLLDEDAFNAFESHFGCLVKLYGSTEMGAIAASSPDEPKEVRAKTVGKLMPGVQMRVVVEKIEAVEDIDDIGELWCHHEWGFEGFIDESGDQDSQGVPTTDDWFQTKDLGRIWADDYLEVLGRCDHSVNRDGLLVFFADVERKIESIEGIDAVVVVSKGESQRGKGLVAYCVLTPNISPMQADLRAACFKVLPRRAIPDEVFIIKSLPMLPNGKVDRQKLVHLDDLVSPI